MPEANDPVEEMYDLLAMELLNRLRTPACSACGTHGLAAAELNQIRQFLSDNEMKRIIRANPKGPKMLPRDLPFGPEASEQPVQKLG